MKILSIETSADDTALSIMEVKGGVKNATFKVLANFSNSQIDIHRDYGGIYPVLAKREHAKNLPILFEACLKKAGIPHEQNPDIDLIAVTYGPGLEMCLWEGITFAKNLAEKWKVPVIPVNHMEGHLVSPFGKDKGTFTLGTKEMKTPALTLLVSGGHTQLILMKKWMEYEIIGETLDDAVGEAFDKVARMLNLPYPGGPQISKLAEELRLSREGSIKRNPKENENQFFLDRNFSTEKFAQSSGRHPAESQKELFSFSLPRPMLYSKNLDFSFSGLKTAVLYLIRDLSKQDSSILQNDKIKSEIALEFENAAIECLTYKTKKAIEKYNIKTLLIGGGVSANKHLRNEMKKITGKKTKLLFPTQSLSGDNSIMIGMAGYLNYIKNKKKVPKLESIKADGNLRLK